MKITISVKKSRTYALGKYENIKPEFTITEEFELPISNPLFYQERLDKLNTIIDLKLREEKAKIDKFISKKSS